MADIQKLLEQMLTAVYGKDVRQTIYDAIKQCYDDGKADVINYQVREDIDKSVANYLAENPVSGGLTPTAKKLLITILRNGLFSTDQSANITLLETALGQSSSDTTVYYIVSNSLTNVTSNNANTSVLENSSYIATLTADTGYAIDSVTVTMGDSDVTSTVYADGVITIASVTGNITITASAVISGEISGDTSTAELVTDGLLGYWDFRNPAEPVVRDWHWAYPPNEGSSELYFGIIGGSKNTVDLPTFDSNYGCQTKGIVTPDHTSYPALTTANDFGTEFTWCFLSYNGLVTSPHYFDDDNVSEYKLGPVCNNTSNATTTTTYVQRNETVKKGFVTSFVVVKGESLKLYVHGELVGEYVGSDYSDFASWYSLLKLSNCTNNVDNYAVAMACYGKALSEVELTETQAFFETLGVA